MSNPIGRLVAAFAAVGAVALPAVPAVAQEDTVTIEGLVWFDRNADGRVDAGEPPLANGRAVSVFNADTKAWIGEYRTDAAGRYRAADLPSGVRFAIYNVNTDYYEATNASTHNPTGPGTYDFGIRGGTLHGFSFVDDNEDGVRQPTEGDVPGEQTIRLIFDRVDRPAPTRGPNGEFTFHDLPFGEHLLLAADRWPVLKIAAPLADHDVDPVTRQKAVHVSPGGTVRVDARYSRPDGDFTLDEPRLLPARDVYRVGDEVEFVVRVTNNGEAPNRTALHVLGEVGELVAASDNVEAQPTAALFHLRESLDVGESTEVSLRYVLDDPAIEELHLFADPVSLLGHPDVNDQDNHAVVPVEVEAGTTSTTTTTTTTTTAAETSTTTATPPVVQAGSGSGLAETGAAPFPFLAIGGLLLGGGALTFLAARGRRRA